MQLAIEQAKAAYDEGEVPVGAVVVRTPFHKPTSKVISSPEVVAVAHNMREQTADPGAHAEALAIRAAASALGRWRLSDCTVYVTLEPCIMCAGLMHQARIFRCVYGTKDGKAGAMGSLYNVNSDERLNHCFQADSGIAQDECAQLLKRFFSERRK